MPPSGFDGPLMTNGEPDSRWKLIFTTDALEERARFDAYREEFAVPFGGVDVSNGGSQSFHVRVWQQNVGALSCARFSASPTRFTRGSRQLRDGDDSILLLMASVGSLDVWQREMRHRLLPGDIVVVSNGEERGGDVSGEGFAIQFSREALSGMLARDINVGPAALPRDAVDTKLLAGYLTSFLELPPIEHECVNDAISRHVMELVALALGANGHAKEIAKHGGVRAARLRAVKADIRQGVGIQDLSVTATASRHGVTPRYIQMLFEQDGSTYSEFVLAERLLKAFSLLSDAGKANLRISEVAYSVGFSDLSYFNRTFRRRFGATPSEIRGRG